MPHISDVLSGPLAPEGTSCFVELQELLLSIPAAVPLTDQRRTLTLWFIGFCLSGPSSSSSTLAAMLSALLYRPSSRRSLCDADYNICINDTAMLNPIMHATCPFNKHDASCIGHLMVDRRHDPLSGRC